ncbi:MAG: T9SS type A sorting domain-containing protein, partial [Bacteroidales bacterium]
VSSDSAATNIIPSMQGFFVHVTDGTFPVTGTLGVNNSVRVNDLTHPFLKSANASDRFLLRASASFTDDNASADPLVVYFDPAAENTFDGKYDALKLMNTDLMVTNFYSVLPGDVRLSINALPNQADSTLYVPLGLKIYRDGEVRFKLVDLEMVPPGMDIYFKDDVTGTNTDLLRTGEYRVILTAGDYEKRFLLAFQKTTTGIITPGVSPDIFTAYWSSGGLVKSTVWKIDGDDGLIAVYDQSGRLVFAKKVYETGHYDLVVNVRQGMYIIRYATGNLQRTVKLTIGL